MELIRGFCEPEFYWNSDLTEVSVNQHFNGIDLTEVSVNQHFNGIYLTEVSVKQHFNGIDQTSAWKKKMVSNLKNGLSLKPSLFGRCFSCLDWNKQISSFNQVSKM